MALYAFKNGVTTLSEDNLNMHLIPPPFDLIYEGSCRDSKTGAGVTENSIADYSYCAKFTLTGATDIGRVELELDADGAGEDVTVQIRSGMVPGSGTDGTTLATVVVPAEFIPTSKAYWSVPINLTGLTSGGEYWLVVTKAGDSTDKVDWIGEASADGSYPAFYRSGDSGNWTSTNALHFKVYSNDPAVGQDLVIHTIEDTTAYYTHTYDVNDYPAAIYSYIPPSDGAAGGVREILTFTVTGGYLMGGA